MDNLLQKINATRTRNYHCLICGDINQDLMKFESNPETGRYVDMLLTNNFIPYTLAPTRYTDNSATAIDHFYLNLKSSSDFINKIFSGNIVYDISDHLANYFVLKCNKISTSTANRPLIRIFSDRAKRDFYEKLGNTDWQSLLANSNCPSLLFKQFDDILIDLYNQSFPLVRCSRKRSKDKLWISKGLLKSSATKQNLYKKWLLSKDNSDKEIYLRYNRLYLKLIKKAQSDYFSTIFNKQTNSIKAIWNQINNLMAIGKKRQRKSNSIKNVMIDNNCISEPQEIANEMNKYFCSIGEYLKQSVPPSSKLFSSYLGNPVKNSFFCDSVQPIEIINCISLLSKKNSSGPDLMNSKIINMVAPVIAAPLSYIYNLSLKTGIFPENLKIAKVIPIFKKGDNQLISNYRPISLLSVFSKIFEKLIAKRMRNYLDKYSILTENLFGFREKHSTTLALINIIDNIYSNLNDNNLVVGIFFDLSKAFDCVDKSILLKKLYHHGFRGKIHDWFFSYLSQRNQFVSIHNCSSSIEEVKCGVPQGSVLGPLFLIYINDIVNIPTIQDSLKLFADDTNMFISGSDFSELENKSNAAIKLLSEWMSANRLTLNVDKTCSMLFLPPAMKLPITPMRLTINGNEIKAVESSKFLGVVLDTNLNWKAHITEVYSNIIKYTSIFYKIRQKVPFEIMKSIYFSTVHCKILYGIELYANTFPSYLEDLIILNNKILRIAQNKPFITHRSTLYKNYNTLPIDILFKQNLLVFTHKLYYHKSILRSCFENYFSINTAIHYHNTRSAKLIHRHHINNTFGSRNLKNLGAKMWNSLPTSLAQVINIPQFKKLIKTLLLSELF